VSTLVVFDSNSGNTRLVAEAIAEALGRETPAVSVTGIGPDSLTGVDLLVVGCPIIAWRPSPRMQEFLAKLGRGSLRGIRAAAFDTRIRLPIHGDAAGRVSRALEAAGAQIAAKPAGFIVDGKSGPLAEGELDRARHWAGSITTALTS
jgi:flavodoxin